VNKPLWSATTNYAMYLYMWSTCSWLWGSTTVENEEYLCTPFCCWKCVQCHTTE